MPYQPLARGVRAVLIGVADYDDPYYGTIRSAEVNVEQLREVLTDRRRGRLPAKAVRAFVSPKQGEIIAAVQRAADEATSLLLVYFAGHGHLHQNLDAQRSELYLLPRETRRAHQRLHGVAYADLRDLLVASAAERVVLILDCCFSGNAHRDPPTGRSFALITSSKPQQRHSRGDGANPTPFTAALLAALRGGVDEEESVTVGSLAAPLREQAERDAAAADRAKSSSTHPGDWSPNVLPVNGVEDTVLSFALRPPEGVSVVRRLLRRLRGPSKRLRTFLRRVWFWIGDPSQPWWHRPVAVLVAMALLAGLGAAGAAVRAATAPPPDCPIPLQLRVTTSPEYEQPLTEVVEEFEEFEASRDEPDPLGDRPGHCRQLDAEVSAAPGTATLDGFANSAAWAEPELSCLPGQGPGECHQPLRDFGPRPDVWLAPSRTAFDRVEDLPLDPASELWLGEPVAVAHSPAVVAVPGGLDGFPDQNANTLAELLAAVAEQGMEVRRAAPAASDASLLHGVVAEDRLDDEGVLPADDRELLCSLAETGAGAGADAGVDAGAAPPALLVAERSMVPLVRDEYAPACLRGPAGAVVSEAPSSERYTAYYPTDVSSLDLTLVPVAWEDAGRDAAQRAEAVDRLSDWLTSDAGQDALQRQGFRPLPGDRVDREDREDREDRAEATEPAADSPLNDRVFLDRQPSVGPRVMDGEAADYLADQQGARPALDVVFVVDLSSSSYAGDRADLTDALLRDAVAALDASEQADQYGIIVTPDSPDDEVGERLALDPHEAATGATDQLVDEFDAIEASASIEQALQRALEELSGSWENGRAPLVVLITDDEDSSALPDRSVAPEVPVAIVSLGDLGCALPFNEELTGQLGLCIDDGQNQRRALVELLVNLDLADGEATP